MRFLHEKQHRYSKGISIFCEKNNDIFFKIFGDKNLIEKNISKKVKKDRYDIIHTDDFVKDEDSAFMGAKNKKTRLPHVKNAKIEKNLHCLCKNWKEFALPMQKLKIIAFQILLSIFRWRVA